EKYTSSVDVFSLGLIYSGILDSEKNKGLILPLPAVSPTMTTLPIGALLAQPGSNVKIAPIADRDPQIVKDVKRLIHTMVGATAQYRISSSEVKKEMDRMFASVEKGIPAEGQPKARRRRAPQPQPQPRTQDAPEVSDSENAMHEG
ncbi:unnamed protein product, partial [Owenia fusiformis]